MSNILLVFICLIIGVILQRLPIFNKGGHLVLNQYVIYVAMPALALYYIPKITISTALLYPLGIAWLGFGFSYIFFNIIGQFYSWSKKLTGALIITSGLSNTSFVGFPVIEALYGEEGLKTAIIADQPGSFIVVSTLAVMVAAAYSRGESNSKAIINKVVSFPPFIAFTFALIVSLLKLDFPEALQISFHKIGQTVTPVALIAVGLQLKFDKRNQHYRFLSLGLFFKLFIMPAFFFVFYKIILKQDSMMIDVTIMEAAMAPMITGTIVAANHGLKPKLCNLMVGVGIPISFITLAFWYWILSL